MKKLLIFLALLLIVVLLSPLVGNKVIDDELSSRLEVLTSYGVEIKENRDDSSYFSSSKHYKLRVEDSEKFVTYIQQFSDSQLPPYVNSLVDGVTIGTDIKYSNFPISDGLSVDIYPLTFSNSFTQSVAQEDAEFLKYLENILQTKGILYHINYNVLKSEFDGYIKDIKESYILKDGTKMSLNLNGSTFNGDGVLLAPDRIDSAIKHIILDVESLKENINISLKGWTSTSNFDSATTYVYGGSVDSLKIEADKTAQGDVSMEFKKLHLNFSSNTQGKKAQFYTKSSFEEFVVMQNSETFRLGNFNYDISIKDIDKDSFEKLRVLLIKAKVDDSEEIQDKMEDVFTDIISNGLELLIADLSVKKIDYKKEKNIDGFSIKTNLQLEKDLNIKSKITSNPTEVAKSVTLDSTIKISQQMFGAITREAPIVIMIKTYAKESVEDLEFHFILKDGKLTLNGKALG